MKKFKKIPKFKNENQERQFWAINDSTTYLNWAKAQRAIFPSLKHSSKTISLRLPEALLARIQVLAHKRDIPYQSLIKQYLAQSVIEVK